MAHSKGGTRKYQGVPTDGPACTWRKFDAYGYVLVRRPSHPYATKHGCVMEHRLVVEQALGHVLRPDAPVHHIDGNKANNHPSNLVACDSHTYHALLHGRDTDHRWKGFTESLRRLIEVEQFTLEDIGGMFAVSRERVRQWCVARGFEPRRHRPTRRMWSDDLCRFVPIASAAIGRASTLHRSQLRLERSATVHAERVRLIRQHLDRLRADIGREPTWGELSTAVVGNANCLSVIQFFSVGLGAISTREKHAAFCTETGYVPRRVGGAGHINPRMRKSA